MRICRFCGEEMDNEEEYCPRCGMFPPATLNNPRDPHTIGCKVCPSCRIVIPIEIKSCPRCKYKFPRIEKEKRNPFSFRILAFIFIAILIAALVIIITHKKPENVISPDPVTKEPVITEVPTMEPTNEPTARPTDYVPVWATLMPTKKTENTPEPIMEETVLATADQLSGITDGDFIFVIQSIGTETVTTEPIQEPTSNSTAEPTATPTMEPTTTPTAEPTATPTMEPTAAPTAEPTATPTMEPTATPTVEPTATPTFEPTATPATEPSANPTDDSTEDKELNPTDASVLSMLAERITSTAMEPTNEPTTAPTIEVTATPTASPTAEPTLVPTAEPTLAPTAEPTTAPTAESTSMPNAESTIEEEQTYVIPAQTRAPMTMILRVTDEYTLLERERTLYKEAKDDLSEAGIRHYIYSVDQKSRQVSGETACNYIEDILAMRTDVSNVESAFIDVSFNKANGFCVTIEISLNDGEFGKLNAQTDEEIIQNYQQLMNSVQSDVRWMANEEATIIVRIKGVTESESALTVMRKTDRNGTEVIR